AGKLSITRATRALTFLSELGLITYQTEYDPLIGCYIPTDITFTSALFAALDVSGEPAEFGKNRTLRFSGHP
ncbi:replication initiation protein, partial [Escherichia coli]|nr:replication initiation protein [Escherichia coli]